MKFIKRAVDEFHKGLGSIRGYFCLNILGKLNTFVHLVLYLHNVNVITCF